MKEQIYEVPVTWEAFGIVKIKGTSPENALSRAERHIDDLKLPKTSNYVDASFRITNGEDREEVLAMVVPDRGLYPEEEVQEFGD